MTAPTGNPTGRPQFKPTRENRLLVELMAGCGIKHTEIRLAIEAADGRPISDVTLRKHFRNELTSGRAKLKGKCIASLVSHMNRNVAAAIFLCKTVVGLKETQVLEHVGHEGGPIVSATKVTVEEAARAYQDMLGGG